jgi:hypothetical protein
MAISGTLMPILETMRQSILLLTSFFLIFLVSCENNYGDEFYGTYSDDTFEANSKLTFYKQNTYSFNSLGVLRSHDSGTVVLRDDTIYFTSFYKKRGELDIKSNSRSRPTLTGYKFTYQKDKICYIHCNIYPDKHKICDTVTWKKTIEL